ncbi:type II 3-dehydroquinate dehydratase [Agrococcus sp. 1P02AA]|uniref:type II 3-dehydroquinate dehydratase n=1 Tax=Agrococcus sp. 1P02AA TaxID=3132259 RepID=UPI0039A552D6
MRQTDRMRILVLNGPNLGRLGTREPEVYGSATLDAIAPLVEAVSTAALTIEADVRQTDDEAELVSWIHEAVDAQAPVILNPAAFTHYSYALRDACAQLQGVAPLIEVHISNPHARETFRHTSVISAVATGVIAGFGLRGYALAAAAIAAR